MSPRDFSPREFTPRGPLSGKRLRWRRQIGLWLDAVGNLWLPTALGLPLRARLQASCRFETRELRLARGGQGLDGLSIVFLSDVHAGHVLYAAELERLARLVAALEPDLVLLGGDLVNTRWEELRHWERAFELLRPPLGIAAVPGNHEYYRKGHCERWAAWLAERGVRVLLNQSVRVARGGAGLLLAGIDDMTEGSPDLEAALAERRADEPVILLSHHPDAWVVARERGVDLQFSGHTHGGQIKLFGWSPLHHSHFGYNEGDFHQGPSHLVVGRGVGVTALPFRFAAAPEVPVLRLRTPS